MTLETKLKLVLALLEHVGRLDAERTPGPWILKSDFQSGARTYHIRGVPVSDEKWLASASQWYGPCAKLAKWKLDDLMHTVKWSNDRDSRELAQMEIDDLCKFFPDTLLLAFAAEQGISTE